MKSTLNIDRYIFLKMYKKKLNEPGCFKNVAVLASMQVTEFYLHVFIDTHLITLNKR